jgi:hypothetical protein
VNVDLLTSRNESTWTFTAKHCCTLFTNWVLLAYRRQGGMLCGLASRWGRSGSYQHTIRYARLSTALFTTEHHPQTLATFAQLSTRLAQIYPESAAAYLPLLWQTLLQPTELSCHLAMSV